jgi:cytochrome c
VGECVGNWKGRWSGGEVEAPTASLLSGVLLAGLTTAVLSLTACGTAESVSTIPSVARAQLGQREVPDGDEQRGRQAISAYGCGACHVVPGVAGARGLVGPPLTSFGHRAYVAGSLPNTPANLVRFIQMPQSIRPGSAMPNLDVAEPDARDIAAYLYSLE